MNAQQLQKLKSLLLEGGELKPKYRNKSHEEIADIFREETAIIVQKSVDLNEFIACISISDLKNLKPDDKLYIDLLTRAQIIKLTPLVKKQLTDIFPAGSDTRNNLLAILTRVGPLVEKEDIPQPTTSDIADALLRT